MRKIITVSLISAASFGAFAQGDAMRDLACKSFTEEVKKNIVNTENSKKSIKSATWVKLAESYLDHAAQCGQDSSASIKAYKTYQKALEVENASGGKKSKDIEEDLKSQKLYSGLLQQGAAYYNGKNLSKASEHFGLSLLVNPKDTTAALYAGIADQTLGNNEKAAKSFNAYLNNGGKEPSVYYSLAQMYKMDQKYDKAIEILRKGVEVNPTNPDLKAEIINTYIASKNIEGAIMDLEKMAQSDPSNVSNFSNLGLLYDNRALDLNTEISDLKAKLAKNDTDDLEKQIATEKDKVGIFEQEIISQTAKMKKDPKNAANIKKRIAEIASQKVGAEEAFKTLSAELEKKKSSMSSSSATAAAKLVEVEAKQKMLKNKALENYKKVLSIEPDNYDVNFNMAVLYFNEAVETKKAIDAMDMKTYQAEGKAIEKVACAQFAKAKPYFDKCSSLKADDELVIENLNNLGRILEQCK